MAIKSNLRHVYRQIKKTIKTTVYKTNVREYRRDNQKWTIQRNWQRRVHKTKTNKTKTQHVVGHRYALPPQKKNVNKT